MTLECRDCGRGLVGGVYVSSGGVHRCRGCHEKMLNHWAERFRRKLGRGYVEEEAGVMRRLEPEVVEVVEAVEAEAEPVREAGAGAWRRCSHCSVMKEASEFARPTPGRRFGGRGPWRTCVTCRRWDLVRHRGRMREVGEVGEVGEVVEVRLLDLMREVFSGGGR